MFLVSGCAVDPVFHHPGSGGSGGTNGGGDLGGVGGGGGSGGSGGSGGGFVPGDAGVTFTVYAHSNDTLYTVDIANKALVKIGPFNAPTVGTGKTAGPDVIQDLAVTPDNTIYVISKTTLYTADPKDGHVTVVGGSANVGLLGACGMDNVALTTTPDGKLYSADYQTGSFCEIDPTKSPPGVTKIGTLGSNLAISGDIVGLGDGSIYGTAYNLSDPSTSGTSINNVLVKLDPTTGSMQMNLGATGFPKLFGVALANDQFFGFTHDGSGDVITIDPKTGKGTLFNTFTDPMTGKGIPFAGAGVSSLVPPPPIG